MVSLGFFAFGSGTAGADSVCYKGYRDTTASERATMVRNLEAIRRALPPAPTGWVIVGDDQVSVQSSLCMDYERKPWTYQFGRSYQRVDNEAEREQATRAAADIWKADQARKQSRLDALMARQQTLSQQQVAFIQKGEMEKAVALNEQMAALQDEYKRVVDEGDAQERATAIMMAAEHDTSMHVTVAINSWAESPPGEGATSLTPPAGAVSAWRWSVEGDVPQDRAMFLDGLWRPRSGGGFALVARNNVPANFAHSMTVNASADPGRLDSVLAGIDFPALANLLAP